jgi:hypothetical protein
MEEYGLTCGSESSFTIIVQKVMIPPRSKNYPILKIIPFDPVRVAVPVRVKMWGAETWWTKLGLPLL